ncbi:hypothetical protein I317_04554 [Kwoniella heveanensis CBS 569]|nr:hypothetical protein I317_04554 [Kwoniella heveanensis CBS 569]
MAPGKQKFRPPKPVQRPAAVAQQQSSSLQATAQAHKTHTQTQNHTQSQNRNQTQSPRQDLRIVNKQESLRVIRTTLEASLGTICYLRNLLPDGAFTTAQIASSRPPPGKAPHELYQLSPEEAEEWNARCEEDRELTQTFLLLPEQSGVMEGVNKGYVQSMAFVVGLDKDQPSDIVESYTFNFFYHPSGAPGLTMSHTNGIAPSSQLEESFTKNETLGAPMTHLDVRRAVKDYTKQLIKVCFELEDLPPQRWVDLKVYFNASAPKDYVLPGFADSSSETLMMGTHSVEDTPTVYHLGPVQTGHHGVSVTALTVADHLPASTKAPVDGYESQAERMSRIDDNLFIQEKSMAERNVVWDADRPAHDRLVYESDAIDVYQLIDPDRAAAPNAPAGLRQPIGQRARDGVIAPIAAKRKAGEEPIRGFKSFKRAATQRDGRRNIPEESLQLSQTVPQTLTASTQAGGSLALRGHDGSIPNESHTLSLAETVVGSQASVSAARSPTLDGIAEEDGVLAEDDGNFSMDAMAMNDHSKKSDLSGNFASATNRNRSPQDRDLSPPQNSFHAQKNISGRSPSEQSLINNLAGVNLSKQTVTTPNATAKPSKTAVNSASKASKPTAQPKPKPKSRSKAIYDKGGAKANSAVVKKLSVRAKPKTKSRNNIRFAQGDIVNCYCGSKQDEGPMLQCDGCKTWYHAHCVGYFEANSKMRNSKFFCLTCEIRKDRRNKWTEEEIQEDLEKMKTLSLKRWVMGFMKEAGEITNDRIQRLQEALQSTSSEILSVLGIIEEEGFLESSEMTGDGDMGSYKRWVTTADQMQKFMQYFQPGSGVEIDQLRFRKFQLTPRKQPTKRTNKPTTPALSTSSKRKQTKGAASKSNGHQQEASIRTRGEEGLGVSPHAVKTRNGSLSPGIDGPGEYGLPPLRSARANALIEVHDYWTEGSINISEVHPSSQPQPHSLSPSQSGSQRMAIDDED